MLQSKDFAVTGVSASGTITYTYLLRVREHSVDPAQNTSHITVEAILKQTYSGTAFSQWSTGVSCSLDGETIFSDYRQRRLSGTEEHIYYTWEGDIPHDADGQKTLTVTGNFWQASPGNYSPPAMTVPQGTMALTTIPRASKVGAADGSIGSNTTIVITPAAAGFAHSIAFSFGELTGYIGADGSVLDGESVFGATAVSFPIPENFYWQIPDSPEGVCTLTVTTYSGGTPIGTAQTSFRCIAEKSRCAPILTASVIEGNSDARALTGDQNILVRYLSTAVCSLAAVCQWGARQVSATCNGIPMGESLSVPNTETGQYVFRVVDSRGHEAVVTVTRPLVPYVLLTCHGVANRTAPTTGEGVLTVQGSGFFGSFGETENALTARYRVLPSEQWQSLSPEKNGDGYTARADLSGMDYTRSHIIELEVSDKASVVTKQVTLQPGIPVFCWGKDYFRFHVPVQFAAGIIE